MPSSHQSTPSLFLAVFIVMALLSWSVYVNDQPDEFLIVDSEELHFGDAPEQSDFPWQISVRNASKEMIRGIKVDASCVCTKISPQQFDLAPNASVVLNMSLDLSASKGSKIELGDNWAFQTSIVAIPKSVSVAPVAWELKGTVHRVLAMESEVIDLGAVGLLRSKPAVVNFAVDPRISDVAVEVSQPEHFSASITQRSKDGKDLSLTVWGKSELPIGPIRSDASLVLTSSDWARPYRYMIPMRGTKVSSIEFAPSVLSMGLVANGTSSRAIIIQSKTNSPIHISEWNCSSSEVSVNVDRRAASRLRVIVTVVPKRFGAFSEELLIKVTCGDDPAFSRVLVPLSYEHRPS